MHLLTAELGGKGTDSNLVPAHGPMTNVAFRDAVEHPARDAVIAGEPIIWYEVTVRYNTSDEDTYGLGFPSYIQIRWGGYKEKDGKWTEKDPAARKGRYDQSPKFPNLQEIDPTLLINFEGRTRVQSVLKISESEARSIVNMRKSRKFDNKRDLLSRARGLNSAVADQITTSLDDSRKVSYIKK